MFIVGLVLAAVFGSWSGVMAEDKQAGDSLRKGTVDRNTIKVPDFSSPAISAPEDEIPFAVPQGHDRILYQLREKQTQEPLISTPGIKVPFAVPKREISIPYKLPEVTLPSDVTEEASKALQEVLIQLVKGDERYAKKLGFESENEVHNCMLGRPLQVFEIGLRDLHTYGKDSSSLSNLFLNQVEDRERKRVPIRLVYPICRKDTAENPTCTVKNIRSSAIIIYSPEDSKWHLGGLGLEVLIKAVFKFEREIENSFILWVPPLNGYYLGTYHYNSMQIIPLVKDPRFKEFTQGVPVTGDFFTVLQKVAGSIDERLPH